MDLDGVKALDTYGGVPTVQLPATAGDTVTAPSPSASRPGEHVRGTGPPSSSRPISPTQPPSRGVTNEAADEPTPPQADPAPPPSSPGLPDLTPAP